MLLRASGETAGSAVELAAVNGGLANDGGVAHGARLVAFTEAVMRGDDAAVARERAALRAVLTPEQLVDVAAVIGSFNVVDRVADATGIPLDAMLDAGSADLRAMLGLDRFASAANTPTTPQP
jgi:alkylhydroperoxidase family enzyme